MINETLYLSRSFVLIFTRSSSLWRVFSLQFCRYFADLSRGVAVRLQKIRNKYCCQSLCKIKFENIYCSAFFCWWALCFIAFLSFSEVSPAHAAGGVSGYFRGRPTPRFSEEAPFSWCLQLSKWENNTCRWRHHCENGNWQNNNRHVFTQCHFCPQLQCVLTT